VQIADQTEKVDSITRKIKGAMTYPMIMIVGMVGCVAILMIKVIPTLTGFFGDPKNLPEATRLIISVSDFFINYWAFLLTLVIGIVSGIKVWKKTKTGKYYFDSYLLRMPIYGPLVTKVILSRFARIFANLL